MKVLLLIKRFQYGGAENHVCELANALAETGHSVWVLSGEGAQRCRLHPRVHYETVHFSDLKIPFHLLRLIRLIKVEKIEVIHAHQRLPVLLGTLAARWMKIPVVATIHGSAITDLRSEYVKRNIDKVIAIRASSIACLEQLLKAPQKIELIHNGIRPPLTCLDRYVDPDSFSLYYVSRLDRHHTSLLIHILTEVWPEVVRKYPHSHLHIVGEGTGMKSIRESLAKRTGFIGQASVHLDGYASEVEDYYPDADLVLGVGRVAIESMVHGVPVLSVKHNHLGPIVTQSNLRRMQFANFVDLDATAPDRKMLLSKLFDFLDHRRFYENEAKCLQYLANREYNIAGITKKIVHVYSDAIKSSGQKTISVKNQGHHTHFFPLEQSPAQRFWRSYSR